MYYKQKWSFRRVVKIMCICATPLGTYFPEGEPRKHLRSVTPYLKGVIPRPIINLDQNNIFNVEQPPWPLAIQRILPAANQ